MEVLINNESIELQKRDRKVGSEAPSVRVKMLNGDTKVIGMMAPKVQAMITLPLSDSLSDELENILNKHKEKALIYIASSQKLNKYVDESCSTIEFKDFATKFGVFANEEFCAKSVFIIDKEGEIKYKEVLADLTSEFDLDSLDKALEEAINFKQKGHTHENWMGV
ncbi:MAG: hypothetical protein PQJ44_06170 [Sphaerochaetaceae bacterium]|nr:hypothetical protein [Sphaerochaetaceae bacterium]